MPISAEAVRALGDYRARWANWMIVDVIEWLNNHTSNLIKDGYRLDAFVPIPVDPDKTEVV